MASTSCRARPPESVRLQAKDGEPRVALGAFSILVKGGQPDDLAELCRYVAAGGDAIAYAAQSHNFTALEKLRDPATRPALECIARSGITQLQLPAMDAIRGIASPASVPELIRHLDDPSPVAQYLAVITLSEITRRPDEPGPLMPEFMKEPARFRDSWKLCGTRRGTPCIRRVQSSRVRAESASCITAAGAACS
jgi:hypothetical protein